MNNCLKFVLIIVFACTVVEVNAAVINVDDMKQVQTKIEKLVRRTAASEMLVAFDIDLTLTQPDQPALYYPMIKKHKAIYNQIMSELTPAQRDLTLTLAVQQPQILIDQLSPIIVRNIQGLGLKTIAFTAAGTGTLQYKSGEILRIENERYKALEKLSINFSKSFATEEIVFRGMPSHNGNYPVFYKGILFSNGEKDESGKTKKTSKGSVLVAFLEHLQLEPKFIVLIDDKMGNLLDVEQYLWLYNPEIKFLGIEYRGAYDYAPKDIGAEEFRQHWQSEADRAKILLPSQS